MPNIPGQSSHRRGEWDVTHVRFSRDSGGHFQKTASFPSRFVGAIIICKKTRWRAKISHSRAFRKSFIDRPCQYHFENAANEVISGRRFPAPSGSMTWTLAGQRYSEATSSPHGVSLLFIALTQKKDIELIFSQMAALYPAGLGWTGIHDYKVASAY